MIDVLKKHRLVFLFIGRPPIIERSLEVRSPCFNTVDLSTSTIEVTHASEDLLRLQHPACAAELLQVADSGVGAPWG